MTPAWKKTLSVMLCAAMIAGSSMMVSADTMTLEENTVVAGQEEGTLKGDSNGTGEGDGEGTGEDTSKGTGESTSEGTGEVQTKPEDGSNQNGNGQDGSDSIPLVPVNPPAEVPAEELTPATLEVVPMIGDEDVCKIGETGYTTLEEAVTAAEDGNTITLVTDALDVGTLTITKRVNLVSEAAGGTTITGNIIYQLSPASDVTTLQVSNLKFAGTSVTELLFRGVGPTNDIPATNITVSNCSFASSAYGIGIYSHANGYNVTVQDCSFDAITGAAVNFNYDVTTAGQQANNTLIFAGTNTLSESVAYAVEQYGNQPNAVEQMKKFKTIAAFESGDTNEIAEVRTAEELVQAVQQPNTTVRLMENIAVSKQLDIAASNVTLDLNGHTLTAAAGFSSTFENDSHLVNVGSEAGDVKGVIIQNGTLRTADKNKHTLNVYRANNITLRNLTLDHTGAVKGAPLVVNASSVTMEGKNHLVLGTNSWYGINVDPKGAAASLAFAEGSSLTASNLGDKILIAAAADTLVDLENAGLTYTEVDGAWVVKDPSPSTDPTPTPDPDPEEKPDTKPSRPSGNDSDDDDDEDDRDTSSSSKPSTGNKVEVVTKEDTTTITTGVTSQVKDETVTAKVSASVMNDAVSTALETAAKKGTAPVVEIQLESSKDAEAMSVTLTTKSLEALAETEGAQLVLSSSAASVTFDAEALQAIVAQAGSNVTLSVAPVATDKLSAAQKASIGDNLVVELLLTSNGKYVTDFNDGQATVTLPYVLRAGETAENLTVWYLDDEGVLHECETRYDAVNQCVIFTTPHFSKYVVGQGAEGTAAASSGTDKSNPSTGGKDMTSALVAAALSLGGVFLLGRKRR